MKPVLSIVVPCYNEEEVFGQSLAILKGVISDLSDKGKISLDSHILFVDDGSKDGTWDLIKKAHLADETRIKGLKLAGNVGHQYALTAGLNTAKDFCDVSISIDADMQDDVSVMEEMIDLFHGGADIVYGVRSGRKNDSFFKRTTAQGFYKIMQISGAKTIYNHADYRLMSKRALQQFEKYHESNLFLRGLIPLMGFQSAKVYYERKERLAGESKYPLKKMIALAVNGITSLSSKPISAVFILGVMIVFISLLAGIYSLVSYFLGKVAPGWTSLILSIWFLGGVQLISIGLIGEYIGKIYIESKHRPRYSIETFLS